MVERVIIAGAGGQGIMLLGKVMAHAAMTEGKNVTWLPAYGAEVRGGTAHCSVIISDEKIGSPYVDKADTLILMNGPSFIKFRTRLLPAGLLLVNTSLISAAGGYRGHRLAAHPFTDIASELGNIKVANMVALGCFCAQKPLMAPETVIATMRLMAPPERPEILSVNKEAFARGLRLNAQQERR